MNRILLACLLACFSVGAWAAPTASTCPANTIRCAAGYAQALNVSTVGNGLYFPTTQQGQVVAQFVGLTASGATIAPQVGVDLVNWTSTAFTIPAASSITADGYYVLPVNGAGFVNFSVTGAGTGSVTVTYQLSPVAPSGAAAGGTINQGAPGTQPWPVVDSNLEAAVGIANGSQPASALQLGGWDGSYYKPVTLNGDDSLWVALDNSNGGAGAPSQPLYVATSSFFSVKQSTSSTGSNCTRSTVATGGTASTLITSTAFDGAIIANPLSATDQGISAAEVAYISQSGTASCSAGNNNTFTLQPGQSYNVPPGTFAISVCAATTGHALFCTKW